MKNSNHISIEDLSKQITNYLGNYTEEISEEIQQIAKEITKEAVTEISKNSPKGYRKLGKRKKRYSQSWKTSKTLKKNRKTINFKNVINNEQYRLTHLLENGHATSNGGFVSGKKHIKPVEQKYIKKYEDNVIKTLKRGL
nr:HK97 gp10 family phage protein [uncultured Tyzzerella sp.]